MTPAQRDRALVALLKLLTRKPVEGVTANGRCFLCPHCKGEGPTSRSVSHAEDCPVALLAEIEAGNDIAAGGVPAAG